MNLQPPAPLPPVSVNLEWEPRDTKVFFYSSFVRFINFRGNKRMNKWISSHYSRAQKTSHCLNLPLVGILKMHHMCHPHVNTVNSKGKISRCKGSSVEGSRDRPHPRTHLSSSTSSTRKGNPPLLLNFLTSKQTERSGGAHRVQAMVWPVVSEPAIRKAVNSATRRSSGRLRPVLGSCTRMRCAATERSEAVGGPFSLTSFRTSLASWLVERRFRSPFLTSYNPPTLQRQF